MLFRSPDHGAEGHPTCALTSPLPRLRIEVADSGYGISEADQERIFERFYRVENAVHTEAGTGLGLSIVRGILEKHGTQIRMASEPGVGTTFWFDLPLEHADSDELALQAERRSLNSAGSDPGRPAARAASAAAPASGWPRGGSSPAGA